MSFLLPPFPSPSSKLGPFLHHSIPPYLPPEHPIRSFQILHHPFQALEQTICLLPLRVDPARQRFVLGLRLGDLSDELSMSRGEVRGQVGEVEGGGGEGVGSVFERERGGGGISDGCGL